MSTVEVRRATSADIDDVTTTLDLAFRNDPIDVWLFPDPADRERRHRGFMRLFAEVAFEAGEVWVAGDGKGAAVWFPVDPAEQSDDEDFVARLGAYVGEHEGRLHTLLETMQAHHPTNEAHLYLNFLAVRPDRQNQGVGAAMLRHRLNRLDAEGVPAYLESSSPRSVPLYAREGFDRIGSLTLPDGGPELTPMWRKPR